MAQEAQSTNSMALTIWYSNIPLVSQQNDKVRVTPDNTFNDIIGTLNKKQRLQPLGTIMRDGKQMQRVYVFKHISKDGRTGQIIQDNNESLQQHSIQDGDELKLFIQERFAKVV